MLTPEAKQLDDEATACFKEWIKFMDGLEANVPSSQVSQISFTSGYVKGKSADIRVAYQAILDLEAFIVHVSHVTGERISLQSDSIDVIKRLLKDQQHSS